MLGVTGCRLVHTYGRLPWEEMEVGGDHLGANHGGEEDMWVDAVVQGASRGSTKVGAHGDAGMLQRHRESIRSVALRVAAVSDRK
jgi:hypothetical protein